MAVQTNLPSYRRPPLGEAVLAAQFQNLERFDVRHIAAVYERFKDRFPTLVPQPPLDPVIERFDALRLGRPINIEMADIPLFPRLWLLDAKGEELVQVQRDRLMHNWRRAEDGRNEYPRYSRLRAAFIEDWKTFSDVAQDLELGSLHLTQCEVSYVNHIEVGELSEPYPDPSKFFTFLGSSIGNAKNGTFEAVTHSHTAVSKGADSTGKAVAGRLYVELTSGMSRRSKQRVFQLTLTVRGTPPSEDVDGALEFFDFARERIVNSFDALTTPAMHARWEKE